MVIASRSSSPNPEQLKAIQHTRGPLLIIAGPGSGKTYTLVERVVNLIKANESKPEELLVLTFTEKAAQELTTRISNRLQQEGIFVNLNEMYLGTFHAVCLRWIEEYREFTRLKRSFTLLDQFDQQFFLYQRLEEYRALPDSEAVLGPPTSSRWEASRELMRWVNTVAEESLNPDALTAAPERQIRLLGRCTALYHRQLEEENALDFSTIQLEARRLLGVSEVREALRARIKYLMVDEYQDTNTIQETILFDLLGEEQNICVVGDDDQGLYRFRGATIRNILEFPKKFAEGACRQVRLTTNYRSHRDIVEFYNRWMGGISWEHGGRRFRFDKTIEPRDTDFPNCPAVLRLEAGEQESFNQQVLELLHRLREAGTLTDWNQVAFLFSSVRHHKAVALANHLERNGIAVYSPRSNQFFEREEVRLMLGALIFLFPQFPAVRVWREGATLDIWDYYDQRCFAAFTEALRRPENEDLRGWARTKAKDHLTMSRNADYSFSGLFYQLLKFPLFSRFLDESLLQQGIQGSRAMRNFASLSQLLGKFEYLHHISVLTPRFLEKNLRDLFNGFFRYLKDGGIDEYEDEAEYAPTGSVSFLTIHQSKGLEYPVVVVGSLYANPRNNRTQLDGLLERYLSRPTFEPPEQVKYYDFYRLFYTAFSRPQNILVLAAQSDSHTPSRPFRDMFAALPRWDASTVELGRLQLERVKRANLKDEYSFTSHISLFENCAEQYRFFRELEFAPIRTSPILFGTLVHQTIEDIHKSVLRGQEADLSEDKIGGWFDLNYAYLTKRERVYLAPVVKAMAREHVLRYYRRQGGDWSRVHKAEVDVSLVKESYILSGTVDLIAGRDGTVELVDFKSEKKPDVNSLADREKISRYKRQLEVYAHIVEQRYGLEVSKTHLYYTSVDGGNPMISFDKDERSLGRTIEVFDKVVGRIESRDFAIPERPAKLCGDCDLKHYCDAKNWKFRKSP